MSIAISQNSYSCFQGLSQNMTFPNNQAAVRGQALSISLLALTTVYTEIGVPSMEAMLLQCRQGENSTKGKKQTVGAQHYLAKPNMKRQIIVATDLTTGTSATFLLTWRFDIPSLQQIELKPSLHQAPAVERNSSSARVLRLRCQI